MQKKNLLKLDLSEYKKKIKALPLTKINKFDNLLSDLANYAYDTYEYVIELPDNKENISKDQASKMIEDLNELNKQVTPLMDILCDMDYESKYMDRATEVLGGIEDDIPELIKLLSRKLK